MKAGAKKTHLNFFGEERSSNLRKRKRGSGGWKPFWECLCGGNGSIGRGLFLSPHLSIDKVGRGDVDPLDDATRKGDAEGHIRLGGGGVVFSSAEKRGWVSFLFGCVGTESFFPPRFIWVQHRNKKKQPQTLFSQRLLSHGKQQMQRVKASRVHGPKD